MLLFLNGGLMNQVIFTMSVTIARRFVEQVFLTDRWDHLFREREPPLTVIPRDASPFCYTEISWGDSRKAEGCELKEVVFSAPQTSERVHVVMRGEWTDGRTLWYPHSIKFDLMAYKVELAHRHGNRIITPTYIVRDKK